jgi:hypothetical protein
MDSLDFDDIASSMARTIGHYRLHFLSTTYDEYADKEKIVDTCYSVSTMDFSVSLSWAESHQQPFSNMDLPRVVFEDPQGVLLKEPQAFALTEDDNETLMERFVAAERVNSGW